MEEKRAYSTSPELMHYGVKGMKWKDHAYKRLLNGQYVYDQNWRPSDRPGTVTPPVVKRRPQARQVYRENPGVSKMQNHARQIEYSAYLRNSPDKIYINHPKYGAKTKMTGQEMYTVTNADREYQKKAKDYNKYVKRSNDLNGNTREDITFVKERGKKRLVTKKTDLGSSKTTDLNTGETHTISSTRIDQGRYDSYGAAAKGEAKRTIKSVKKTAGNTKREVNEAIDNAKKTHDANVKEREARNAAKNGDYKHLRGAELRSFANTTEKEIERGIARSGNYSVSQDKKGNRKYSRSYATAVKNGRGYYLDNSNPLFNKRSTQKNDDGTYTTWEQEGRANAAAKKAYKTGSKSVKDAYRVTSNKVSAGSKEMKRVGAGAKAAAKSLKSSSKDLKRAATNAINSPAEDAKWIYDSVKSQKTTKDKINMAKGIYTENYANPIGNKIEGVKSGIAVATKDARGYKKDKNYKSTSKSWHNERQPDGSYKLVENKTTHYKDSKGNRLDIQDNPSRLLSSGYVYKNKDTGTTYTSRTRGALEIAGSKAIKSAKKATKKKNGR